MEYLYRSLSEEMTTKLAIFLASKLKPKDTILLEGKLGSGKTFFAKGIGLGLGVNETVSSPTFNIVRCYFKGRLPFYHIDAYRLEGLNQDIGLDEYFESDGVCLIEWAEFISDILPHEYLKIKIEITGPHSRDYLFISKGSRYDELVKEIKNG